MSVNRDLIRYRLEKARETLEDAELLLSQNRLSSAVNRLYYSLFYGVLALLETKGLASSKHAGVRALFNQHFVKDNIVSKELVPPLRGRCGSHCSGPFSRVHS
ncbi:HEPN domain-containing protein [Candidatus Hakubella thermalkaliphila]|uniref:HEPN domain-containing protein n=1 Tax=Candidatus Hakubella thermalkaliphila TaxID=2754717 RepID=UPI0015931507